MHLCREFLLLAEAAQGGRGCCIIVEVTVDGDIFKQ